MAWGFSNFDYRELLGRSAHGSRTGFLQYYLMLPFNSSIRVFEVRAKGLDKPVWDKHNKCQSVNTRFPRRGLKHHHPPAGDLHFVGKC